MTFVLPRCPFLEYVDSQLKKANLFVPDDIEQEEQKMMSRNEPVAICSWAAAQPQTVTRLTMLCHIG
jgi:hypothetical protein